MHQILGYISALGAAAAWAVGSILFKRLADRMPALGLNLAKCALGLAYIGSMLVFAGIEPLSADTFLILGISGLLGISLGDTFFFEALLRLGPRLTLLLATLGPAVTVLMAVVLLGEKLTPLKWAGIVLTLSGVTIVLWEDISLKEAPVRWRSGLLYSLLSIITISGGILLAKVGVAGTSAIEATFVRLLWGAAGLFLYGIARKDIGRWLSPLKDRSLMRSLFGGVFVIIVGGFLLFIVALKYIDASIATVLEATTPLWILPISVYVLKEKLSLRAITGAAIAVAGVACIVL